MSKKDQKMTAQEMFEVFDFQKKLRPLIEEECAKNNISTSLPRPALPRALQANSATTYDIVAFSKEGEPIINPKVELDQIQMDAVQALHMFYTLWITYHCRNMHVVEIEIDCIKKQLKKLVDNETIRLRQEDKIAAGVIKHHVGMHDGCTVVEAALAIKEGQLKIMKGCYDGYRRLLNALSRESTNRANFNEYNASGNSSNKWSKNRSSQSVTKWDL